MFFHRNSILRSLRFQFFAAFIVSWDQDRDNADVAKLFFKVRKNCGFYLKGMHRNN